MVRKRNGRSERSKQYNCLFDFAKIFTAVGWVAGLIAIHLMQSLDAAMKMFLYAGYFLGTAWFAMMLRDE